MRKIEKWCPVTPRWHSDAVHKSALDRCEKFQGMFNKKQPGPWLYSLFEGEVWAHQTASTMDLNCVHGGQKGRKISSFFNSCSLRRAVSFCFLWMRSLTLEIFASKNCHTLKKGWVRKPVADWVHDKMCVFLNVKSWCVQEKWHRALYVIDQVEHKGINHLQEPCPSLPVWLLSAEYTAQLST